MCHLLSHCFALCGINIVFARECIYLFSQLSHFMRYLHCSSRERVCLLSKLSSSMWYLHYLSLECVWQAS